MTKLDKAKNIIQKCYGVAECGIFDSRNIIGDPMDNIYDEDGLQIDICFRYEYFEVFGLTDDEFMELKAFYNELVRKDREDDD